MAKDCIPAKLAGFRLFSGRFAAWGAGRVPSLAGRARFFDGRFPKGLIDAILSGVEQAKSEFAGSEEIRKMAFRASGIEGNPLAGGKSSDFAARSVSGGAVVFRSARASGEKRTARLQGVVAEEGAV